MANSNTRESEQEVDARNSGVLPLSKLRLVGFGPDELGGVCAGIAYWLGVPAWLVRVLAVVGLCSLPYVALGYIALWALVPEWKTAPLDYGIRTGLED
jgi:phage shock protein PspC (stress-responsive transcriptional regulator)